MASRDVLISSVFKPSPLSEVLGLQLPDSTEVMGIQALIIAGVPLTQEAVNRYLAAGNLNDYPRQSSPLKDPLILTASDAEMRLYAGIDPTTITPEQARMLMGKRVSELLGFIGFKSTVAYDGSNATGEVSVFCQQNLVLHVGPVAS